MIILKVEKEEKACPLSNCLYPTIIFKSLIIFLILILLLDCLQKEQRDRASQRTAKEICCFPSFHLIMGSLDIINFSYSWCKTRENFKFKFFKKKKKERGKNGNLPE